MRGLGSQMHLVAAPERGCPSRAPGGVKMRPRLRLRLRAGCELDQHRTPAYIRPDAISGRVASLKTARHRSSPEPCPVS